MMNFLHAEFDAMAGDVVEVTLAGNAANVRLLDPANYVVYQTGGNHAYYGGHYTMSPVLIPVPHAGHWHLTVDLGGAAGTVSASFRVLRG